MNALKSLEAEIAALPAKPEELLNIARRGMELRGELKFLFESSEGNYVYWFERRNKGVFRGGDADRCERHSCASGCSKRSKPWC